MFKRKNTARKVCALVENLENRRHLSSVTLTGGVLSVVGSMGSDEITLSLRQGNASQLTVNLNGTLTHFNVSAIDSIIVTGRLGNDRIQCDNAEGTVPFGMTLKGGGDKDSIFGGAFDDTVVGGEADDLIYGKRGNDSMFGDEDNDFIDSGMGEDIVYGGAGNDEIYGGDDNDYLKGGGDNDRISGGRDNDELWGAEGNDTLIGQDGDDFLVGGVDDDDLDGGLGSDDLYGQLGNDDFFGDPDEVRDLASTDNGSNSVDVA